MSEVGQKEILTQKHVIQFFRDGLGYDYLGNWKDRPDNTEQRTLQLVDGPADR